MSTEVRKLIDAFEERRVGRREFLRRALALGLTAGAANALLAACSPAAAPTAAPAATAAPAKPATGAPAAPAATAAPAAAPAATAAPAAAAKPAATTAKELVFLISSFSDEAGLSSKTAAVSGMLHAATYDFPFLRDPKTGKSGLGLVEKFTVSPDYKVWTLNFRKGIQFHEGYGELTSEDVRYTLELMARQDSASPRAGWLRTAVEKVETPDPYTVIMRLKQPSWVVPDYLSDVSPYVGIMSKKYIEKVGEAAADKKVIGSGPYHQVEWRKGEYIVLEAVENHWRVTPAFKKVTLKLVPEPATRLAMVRAGQADVAPISLQELPDAQKAGLEIRSKPGASLYFAMFGGQLLPTKKGFDPKIPWVTDPRDTAQAARALKVRQAMNLAIDRKEIVETILQKSGEPAAVLQMMAASPSYDAKLTPYPYDLAKAKALLAEAGYPNGFPITVQTIVAAASADAPQIAEALAMYWEKLGLQVKRDKLDMAVWRPMLIERTVKQEIYVYANAPELIPSVPLGNIALSTGQIIFTGEWAFLDEMIPKALGEVDEAKRVAIEKEIHKFQYDNYVTIPIALIPKLWALSNKVGEWQFNVGDSYELQQLAHIKPK